MIADERSLLVSRYLELKNKTRKKNTCLLKICMYDLFLETPDLGNGTKVSFLLSRVRQNLRENLHRELKTVGLFLQLSTELLTKLSHA